MIYCKTRRFSSTNQTKNLFVLDDKILKVFVRKFHTKWIEINDSNEINDEKLYCDLTNVYLNDAFNLYAKVNKIDLMFAKWARMKMKMKVWSTSLIILSLCVLLMQVILLKFIRKIKFSSHSNKGYWYSDTTPGYVDTTSGYNNAILRLLWHPLTRSGKKVAYSMYSLYSQ